MEHKLEEVASLLEADIEAEVKRGKRAFDSIATEIQNKVQQSIPEIKDKIRQAGQARMHFTNPMYCITSSITVKCIYIIRINVVYSLLLY